MGRKDKITRKDKLKNQVVVRISKIETNQELLFKIVKPMKGWGKQTKTIISKMLKTIDPGYAWRESKGRSLQEFQCHSPLHRENAENIMGVQEMKKGTWGRGGTKAKHKWKYKRNTIRPSWPGFNTACEFLRLGLLKKSISTCIKYDKKLTEVENKHRTWGLTNLFSLKLILVNRMKWHFLLFM